MTPPADTCSIELHYSMYLHIKHNKTATHLRTIVYIEDSQFYPDSNFVETVFLPPSSVTHPLKVDLNEHQGNALDII